MHKTKVPLKRKRNRAGLISLSGVWRHSMPQGQPCQASSICLSTGRNTLKGGGAPFCLLFVGAQLPWPATGSSACTAQTQSYSKGVGSIPLRVTAPLFGKAPGPFWELSHLFLQYP